MRALVVYESMFGSTRTIAEGIARALDRSGASTSLTTAAVAPSSTESFDLVLVGAPTHAHSLPRPSSRVEAAHWAADPRKDLTLEPSAEADGVREWLGHVSFSPDTKLAAAFSTRSDIVRMLAGDAAVAIAHRLRAHKVEHVEKECFLVTSAGQLVHGELDRAEAWAAGLPALVGALA